MDNRSNSRANTCQEAVTLETVDLLDEKADPLLRHKLNHSNFADRSNLLVGDRSYKFLPYQL
jgi:hypothetical protein